MNNSCYNTNNSCCAKVIYEALQVRFSGGQMKITMTELDDKWDVSVTRICQERDKIWEMIKKRSAPTSDLSITVKS